MYFTVVMFTYLYEIVPPSCLNTNFKILAMPLI